MQDRPRAGRNSAESTTISVGDTLRGRLKNARYHVDEQLGVGGMGRVFRVTHRDSGEVFALKALHHVHASSPALRRRFEREALALEALSHPNVVKISDHGATEEQPYLVMELLRGEELSARLRRKRLEAAELRRIASQLLAAVAYVHGEGLAHRDLKPGNVYLQTLEGETRVKVLDFGFAKFVEAKPAEDADPLTRSGEIFGTPAYMAPEQIGSQETNERTDVYALGVMLFEMVSGRRPFDGDPPEILRGHLVEAPPDLGALRPEVKLSDGLQGLIERALSKSPQERFADAQAMREAFEALPTPLWTKGAEHGASLALAPTVMAQAGGKELAPAASKAATDQVGGVGERALGALGALVGRAVTAGTLAVIALSVVVIVASALAIYAARQGQTRTPLEPRELLSTLFSEAGGRAPRPASAKVDATPRVPAGAPPARPTKPEGPAESTAESTAEPTTEALKQEAEAIGEAAEALVQPLLGELEEQAQAAGNALKEALVATGADASTPEELKRSQPGAVADATETAEPKRPARPAVALPKARNPWRRTTPATLKRILKLVRNDRRGGEATLRTLRRYNREHPEDERGHLLLAGLYFNRQWHRDALSQYELAAKIDPSARGAPRMLADLIELSQQDGVATRSRRFIASLYGQEARAAVARALSQSKKGGAAQARLRALAAAL